MMQQLHVHVDSEEPILRMAAKMGAQIHVHLRAPGQARQCVDVPHVHWEELSGEVPPRASLPPCATQAGAPPGRRRKGPLTPEEKRERWRENKARNRAKKKGEQGGHPVLPAVDSPEKTSNDAQDYTTPAATSSNPAPMEAGEGPECVLGHGGHVLEMSSMSSEDKVDMSSEGKRKGEDFSSAVASFPPKAPPQLGLPGMSSMDMSSMSSVDKVDMSSVVPPRTAPRALAAYRVTAPDGSGRRESALTPEGELVPGFDILDALREVYARHKEGDELDISDKELGLLKRRVQKHNVREVLRRWANAMTHKLPPCDGIWDLDARWNKYRAPFVPYSEQQAAPAPQLRVGRAETTLHVCAVHGCEVVTDGRAFELHLCAAHTDELFRDVPQAKLNNGTAADWLVRRNAGVLQ